MDSDSLCRQAMAFWDTPEFLDACFQPHPSFQMGRRGSDEHRFLCAVRRLPHKRCSGVGKVLVRGGMREGGQRLTTFWSSPSLGGLNRLVVYPGGDLTVEVQLTLPREPAYSPSAMYLVAAAASQQARLLQTFLDYGPMGAEKAFLAPSEDAAEAHAATTNLAD